MTTLILLEHRCDQPSCDAHVRRSHWTALGAQSEARSALRDGGWVTITDDQKRMWHFCPDHAAGATAPRERGWDLLALHGRLGEEWCSC